MNYHTLYSELNRRRKLEINQCKASMLASISLFEEITTMPYTITSEQHSELLKHCINACMASEQLYQLLLETDCMVEDKYVNSSDEVAIVYTLHDYSKSAK